MEDDPTIAERKQHPTALIATMAAVAAMCAVLAAIGWARFWSTATASDNLTVTACAAADFVNDECNGPVLDPDGPDNVGLVLSEDVRFDIAGVVCVDVEAAYVVNVAWVSTEGVELPVVDVPVTWTKGCQAPYATSWVPPRQLLQLVSDVPPGGDLGLWRIVGRAVPVNSDKHSVYQWDSVKTFRLLAPGG